jgi:hypothetical protein
MQRINKIKKFFLNTVMVSGMLASILLGNVLLMSAFEAKQNTTSQVNIEEYLSNSAYTNPFNYLGVEEEIDNENALDTYNFDSWVATDEGVNSLNNYYTDNMYVTNQNSFEVDSFKDYVTVDNSVVSENIYNEGDMYVDQIINGNDVINIEYDNLNRPTVIEKANKTVSLSYNNFNQNAQAIDDFYETGDDENLPTQIKIDGEIYKEFIYNSFNQVIYEKDYFLKRAIGYNYDEEGYLTSKNLYRVFNDYDFLYSSFVRDEYVGVESAITSYNDVQYFNYEHAYKARDKKVIYEYEYEQGIRNGDFVIGSTKIGYSSAKVGEDELVFGYTHNALTSLTNGEYQIDYILNEHSEYVGLKFEENIYYFAFDIFGNISGLVDEEGNEVVKYDVDRTGELHNISGLMANDLGVYNAIIFKQGFIYDHRTGIYYKGASLYDPKVSLNLDSSKSVYCVIEPELNNVLPVGEQFKRPAISTNNIIKNQAANIIVELMNSNGIKTETNKHILEIEEIPANTVTAGDSVSTIDIYTVPYNSENEEGNLHNGSQVYKIVENNQDSIEEARNILNDVVSGRNTRLDGQSNQPLEIGKIAINGQFIFLGKYVKYETAMSGIIALNITKNDPKTWDTSLNLYNYDTKSYELLQSTSEGHNFGMFADDEMAARLNHSQYEEIQRILHNVQQEINGVLSNVVLDYQEADDHVIYEQLLKSIEGIDVLALSVNNSQGLVPVIRIVEREIEEIDTRWMLISMGISIVVSIAIPGIGTILVAQSIVGGWLTGSITGFILLRAIDITICSVADALILAEVEDRNFLDGFKKSLLENTAYEILFAGLGKAAGKLFEPIIGKFKLKFFTKAGSAKNQMGVVNKAKARIIKEIEKVSHDAVPYHSKLDVLDAFRKKAKKEGLSSISINDVDDKILYWQRKMDKGVSKLEDLQYSAKIEILEDMKNTGANSFSLDDITEYKIKVKSKRKPTVDRINALNKEALQYGDEFAELIKKYPAAYQDFIPRAQSKEPLTFVSYLTERYSGTEGMDFKKIVDDKNIKINYKGSVNTKRDHILYISFDEKGYINYIGITKQKLGKRAEGHIIEISNGKKTFYVKPEQAFFNMTEQEAKMLESYFIRVGGMKVPPLGYPDAAGILNNRSFSVAQQAGNELYDQSEKFAGDVMDYLRNPPTAG